MNRAENPKKVLITGCSSGFGLETALACCRAGYEVIATMRNLDRADDLKRTLNKENLHLHLDRLDITDFDQIDEIARKYQDLDVLVNNAGILVYGSFLDLTDKECRRIFETNYFGAVKLAQTVGKIMINRQQGLIVNVTSLAGRKGHPFASAYAAAKYALVGYTESVRSELALFNVDMVSVEPGYHLTRFADLQRQIGDQFDNPQSPFYEYNKGFLRLMRAHILPRGGDPADVAKSIVKIIRSRNRKAHYIVGKQARLVILMQWLGLRNLMEKVVLGKIQKAADREKRNPDS